MLFFFIGAHAFVWDTPYKFERFGQITEMDEEFARAKCLEGLQIIPADDPAAKTFTAAELKQYPARHHPDAPLAFTAKVAAADAALESYRQSIRDAMKESSHADAEQPTI